MAVGLSECGCYNFDRACMPHADNRDDDEDPPRLKALPQVTPRSRLMARSVPPLAPEESLARASALMAFGKRALVFSRAIKRETRIVGGL